MPRLVPRQSEESPSFCDTCPPKSVGSLRSHFGCLTVFDLNESTGARRTTERAAGDRRTPQDYQRWPGRAVGNQPCEQKYREAADPVPPRGATSPRPPGALLCPAAACPRNGRAGTSRRKRPPLAAGSRDHARLRKERIVASSPWRKMQFTQNSGRVK